MWWTGQEITSSTAPERQNLDVLEASDHPKRTLERVRRGVWQDLRRLPDQQVARRFKGARWGLLKNPTDLTDDKPPPYAN